MAERILVVDDDRQIVRLLHSYLEQAGYHVSTANDGEAALRIIRTEHPDLIVLDLMLSGRDGWEIARLVRSDPHLSALPIIMLTARVEDTDKIVGLELGADDYITKPFNPREVLARVRAVLRRSVGGLASPPGRLEVGALVMDLDRHQVRYEGQPIELTPTEYELLRALLEQPSHAFTRRELIERALGFGYESLERTIDSHIKNLRRKVEPDADSPAVIETVFGVGYRLRERESARPAEQGGAP